MDRKCLYRKIKLPIIAALIVLTLVVSTSYTLFHSMVAAQQSNSITIVPGASNANNTQFYNPSRLSVTVGSLVTWVNNDNSPHTVTSNMSQFDSNIIPAGASFSHTFDSPGIYGYYCTIHPFMRGEIRSG
jgi:plastocyanin